MDTDYVFDRERFLANALEWRKLFGWENDGSIEELRKILYAEYAEPIVPPDGNAGVRCSAEQRLFDPTPVLDDVVEPVPVEVIEQALVVDPDVLDVVAPALQAVGLIAPKVEDVDVVEDVVGPAGPEEIMNQDLVDIIPV